MADIVAGSSNNNLVVVVSAMGKTTHNLEKILELAIHNRPLNESIEILREEHLDVCRELEIIKLIKYSVDQVFKDLGDTLIDPELSTLKVHDAIVSKGELLSSIIISAYLKYSKIKCSLINASDIISTNSLFGNATVNWDQTFMNANEKIIPIIHDCVVVTQGYIGVDGNGQPTTLGKEGSDYTAAIIANCLNAESVTIWKDVPGILNADPKRIANPVLFDNLPYHEASEMTYYGATVIHPKTIKPLANKKIPLYVRSFEDASLPGTIISDSGKPSDTPSIIYKDNQVLMTFSVKDLSFVDERSISQVFGILHDNGIQVNLLQTSAISISICIDMHQGEIETLLVKLESEFTIHYNTGLQLITVKNYNEEYLTKYMPEEAILLEQKSRNNYRALTKSIN